MDYQKPTDQLHDFQLLYAYLDVAVPLIVVLDSVSYSISNGLVGADENSVLPSALTSFFRELFGLRYHEVVDSMPGATGGADSIERDASVQDTFKR